LLHLLAHDVGPEGAVRSVLVALAADLLGQVEHDGDGERVKLPREGDERLAGLGLHVRGIDHGEPSAGEPLPGAADQVLAPPAREARDGRLQRDGPIDEVRPHLARARDGAPKHPRERDAEEGRCGIGSVVDVGLERLPVTGAVAPPARQSDGVHLDEQGRGATIVSGLLVEDVNTTEPEVVGLRTRGVLVQKKPQVRCRLVGGRDGQQHRAGKVITRWRGSVAVRTNQPK
jgi:hypothetical protein